MAQEARSISKHVNSLYFCNWENFVSSIIGQKILIWKRLYNTGSTTISSFVTKSETQVKLILRKITYEVKARQTCHIYNVICCLRRSRI